MYKLFNSKIKIVLVFSRATSCICAVMLADRGQMQLMSLAQSVIASSITVARQLSFYDCLDLCKCDCSFHSSDDAIRLYFQVTSCFPLYFSVGVILFINLITDVIFTRG